VERAVERALDDGYRTADLWPTGGTDDVALTRVGTAAMAAAVAERVVAPVAAEATAGTPA
jgi:hypothetical protein